MHQSKFWVSHDSNGAPPPVPIAHLFLCWKNTLKNVNKRRDIVLVQPQRRIFRSQVYIANKLVQPTTAGLWLGFRFPLAAHASSLPPSRLTCGLDQEIYWQPRAQWTFHHSETKVTNHAETIWRTRPGTADEKGIQQGVPPLRATSGAKVNADVGIRIMGYRT